MFSTGSPKGYKGHSSVFGKFMRYISVTTELEAIEVKAKETDKALKKILEKIGA